MLEMKIGMNRWSVQMKRYSSSSAFFPMLVFFLIITSQMSIFPLLDQSHSYETQMLKILHKSAIILVSDVIYIREKGTVKTRASRALIISKFFNHTMSSWQSSDRDGF